jgi:hypothetical protein
MKSQLTGFVFRSPFAEKIAFTEREKAAALYR